MACCSSFGVINEYSFGCIVILDAPDVIVRNLLEYPPNSANGAFTFITFKEPNNT